MAAHGKFSNVVLNPVAPQYLVYGLRISCDRPIWGLTPVDNQTPDIHFLSDGGRNARKERSNEETIWYESYIRDENNEPLLKIWKSNSETGFRIAYSCGLTFELDSNLSLVTVTGAEQISSTEFSSFLLGPVFGILLRMRGETCLHASAVTFADKSLVFAGTEGSGKSTAAAVFARNGHAVLTDDIAVLDQADGVFLVRSGCPILNLLSDSSDWLLKSQQGETPEAETEKQRIVLDGKRFRFQAEGLPVGAVFILDTSNELFPPIQRLSQQEALIGLAAQTYANRMLDTQMRAAEFLTLAALVKSIPVLRVSTRATECGFETFYETVCRSANNLGF